jgi:hypothetical protein
MFINGHLADAQYGYFSHIYPLSFPSSAGKNCQLRNFTSHLYYVL